jgi:hypothetical protein
MFKELLVIPVIEKRIIGKMEGQGGGQAPPPKKRRNYQRSENWLLGVKTLHCLV